MNDKSKGSNQIWYIMAGLFAVPFIIPLITTDPIIMNVSMLGIMIGGLYLIKKKAKTLAQNFFNSNFKWLCLVCGKENKDSTCPRCGSKQSKML